MDVNEIREISVQLTGGKGQLTDIVRREPNHTARDLNRPEHTNQYRAV